MLDPALIEIGFPNEEKDMHSQSFDPDNDLAQFFTDVFQLRQAFRDLVYTPHLPKRLLIIHGVGGVGKSSLLRMFRLHCKSQKVPVALASGDEAKSPLDVLTRWADDLKADGIILPAFDKTLEHYHGIQAKVEEHVRKTQDKRGRAAEITGKAALKTIEAASSALAGAALGSLFPGIGTAIGGVLGGVLGGMGADALADWLRGFLAKPEIALLLDPTNDLSDGFLADVATVAKKRRIVLMLDTFEQMPALSDWGRDVAQRLHADALFVIAGRTTPNWERAWPAWLASAQVEELKPMTDEVMRELIGKYAMLLGGEPDPKQVEAIIHFARGLPMVVTGAVQMWAKYGIVDFQSVKAEVIANLVDRLMEGIPGHLIPALEAAATVRWFDQPILRAVTELEDVRELYNELRRFPFTRTRAEGLALHDAVRDIMDENLRAQDSERHSALHGRAAAYFETRLAKVTGRQADRYGLERLYHRIRADEEAGLKLFQIIAEELARYRLVSQLRTLVNDVDTYPLEQETSKLWRLYYKARLAHIGWQRAESASAYREIADKAVDDPKLKAYALCDLGELGTDLNNHNQAVTFLREGLATIALDPKLAWNLFALSQSLQRLGKADQARDALEQAKVFFEQFGDKSGLAYAADRLKCYYLDQGDFAQAVSYMRLAFNTLATFPSEPAFLKYEMLSSYAVFWALAGQRAENERRTKDALEIASRLGIEGATSEVLGYTLGMEDKYDEAQKYFGQSLDYVSRYEDTGATVRSAIIKGYKGAVLMRQGLLDEAELLLRASLEAKQEHQDAVGIPELRIWLGDLLLLRPTHDRQSAMAQARTSYQQALEYRWTGRRYFECAALTGIVRVAQAQGDYGTIPVLLAEAETIAQQFEYNDHLASLRLTQGHMAWDGHGDATSSPTHVSTVSPLWYYQHALVYAMRYNRFLLDEVLSGRSQGTTSLPIIQCCLTRGDEGRQVLIALRDWWQTGPNDVGSPRPDTISPVPEGISLLEAERIARQHEPGDGSLQVEVVERIEAALKKRAS